ncbi:putative epsilon-adaptin putative AP-1/4 adapter complex gamma/epsilon subunit [Leptomonas seymouri]|uniref:Putative epsilon-adaptin putative AP-1/4 adapter complex gamma/epsilon subunit n=1 Tax=Leptomonas seymouri TaxID=5684 RepID=A0A0N1I3J7_LEPSE|nr:putative epsilon-adaptin putative AP-1/4 adapter complex gamma/epsilon subunit [Leptomonas seymouri]|eukprot:KPI90374.1 putative epsilon-adaptin putative AP-1/4 adapter complex gamma/epsilon subunit [Leptomonas seymouri]
MSKFYSAETQQGHSSHFIQYIRMIAEATSKQEEDQLIEDDIRNLKTTLTSSTARDEDLLKEYAVRAYYAEMMGHSAEFAYIHCINLSCHRKLIFKRTGYLATKLMVNPDSELMYLIVSSIQRDLKSPNYLEVSAALTAAAQMLRPELMTVVQGDLPGLMTHEKPLVRRKVIEAMHAFYVRSDAAIGDVAAFRQALCDRDPSVMDAATRLLREVIQRSPESHRDLLDSFIMILSQVIERRLPRTYEFHHTPAPWLQIRVIQILTVLIGNDPQRAQKAAHVLGETMQRADNGKLIGFAIICELIRTAANIPQLPILLSLSAEAVSGLIKSRNPNLRCAGIQALSYVVRVNRELAAEHQEVVMRCLEDADETIRRKTIWLLFSICDSDNIVPIARRLISFLGKVSDPFLKRSTTRRLCWLMEQYATNPWWYIRTMNSVLAVAADCVLPATIQRMLKLIAEGQGIDEAADTNFRIRCVEAYFAITGKSPPSGVGGSAPSRGSASLPLGADSMSADGFVGAPGNVFGVPDVLCRISAWVMGEYGFLTSRISGDMLLSRLCDLMEQTEDGETRCWILMAIMKVTANTPQPLRPSSPGGAGVSDYADDVVTQYLESRCVPLQQRCYEFAALHQRPELLRGVLPKDGFCEAMDVDPELHFLDSFIETAVARGARPYKQPADVASLRQQRATTSALQAESALRTAAYVPARSTDIRPAWSSSSSPFTGEATAAVAAAHPSTCGQTGVDVSLASTSAGPALSVRQGGEKLVLQPTATKRWGVQNLREMEAAAEEVRLQAAAAAAVGGGGIVWSADALSNTVEPMSAPSHSAAATAAATRIEGKSAFEEYTSTVVGGFGHDSGDAATAARAAGAMDRVKPVSAKNAKFARSIFGGGRRKGREATPSAAMAAPVASQSVGGPTFKEASPKPQQLQPQANVVMDSLFATDSASAHSANSPITGRPDTAPDWLNSSPTVGSPIHTAESRSEAKSALLSSLHPASPSFSTEQFGRIWQVMGVSGERKQQLQFTDISSYVAGNGFLQQHLLHACSMRVVQIIGKELIAAAQYAAENGKEEYVLAHLTVMNASTLNAVVRSSRRELSEEVLCAMRTT